MLIDRFAEYEGNFVFNRISGHGRMVFMKDESCYMGEFFNGSEHGTGELEGADSNVYKGQF